MADRPTPVPSIRRGHYEEQFQAIEANVCTDCGARPGEQCWDWASDLTTPPVRIERVVPHRERVETWESTTSTD